MDDILADSVSENALAEQLGQHPRTLARWRKLGVGPPFISVGRKIRYDRAAARAWLASGGTSAKPAKPRKRQRRR